MCLSIYCRQRHRGGDAEHAGCDDARRQAYSGSRSYYALAESVKNIFVINTPFRLTRAVAQSKSIFRTD